MAEMPRVAKVAKLVAPISDRNIYIVRDGDTPPASYREDIDILRWVTADFFDDGPS